MIINVANDERLDRFVARQRELGEALLDGLKPVEREALIGKNGQSDNTFGFGGTEWLFKLTDGNVAAQLDNTTLFFYEASEIVGFEHLFDVGVCTLKNEFAVRADVFDKDVVFKQLRKDSTRFQILLEYFAVQTSLFQMILAHSLAATRRPKFQIRRYEAGAVIIREGDTDTDVYSLLHGQADVLVRGVKVGEIHPDEIFGEMARLTGAPRSATVQAQSDCEAMVFGGDEFGILATTNPAALHDIARILSERLAKLNQEIAPRE